MQLANTMPVNASAVVRNVVMNNDADSITPFCNMLARADLSLNEQHTSFDSRPGILPVNERAQFGVRAVGGASFARDAQVELRHEVSTSLSEIFAPVVALSQCDSVQ